MSAFVSTTTHLPVRPGDLDSVGHVNNARVLEYLEHARWEWMDKNGLSRGTSIIPVVVRIEADYRAEIAWGALRIETGMLEDDDLTFKAIFRQRIYAGSSNTPSVEAIVHVAFIDVAERSVCTVEDFMNEARAPRTDATAGA